MKKSLLYLMCFTLFIPCSTLGGNKANDADSLFPKTSRFASKVADVKTSLEMILRHPGEPSIFDTSGFQRSYRGLLSKYRRNYKNLSIAELDDVEEMIDLYNTLSREKLGVEADDSVVIVDGIAYITSSPTVNQIEDWQKQNSDICKDKCKRIKTGGKLSIPKEMLINHPCLVYLILKSESISSAKEKQEWFDLYEMMNDEQTYRLYGILYKENYSLGIMAAQQSNKKAYDFAKANDFYNAKTEIDKAKSYCPNEANYYDSEGEFCAMQGRTERAVALWNKVMELDPDFLSKHGGSTPLYKYLKEQGLLNQ